MDTNQSNYLTEICVQVRQIRLHVVTDCAVVIFALSIILEKALKKEH